jgi:L-2,4-diaminobutyrate decarboxylase
MTANRSTESAAPQRSLPLQQAFSPAVLASSEQGLCALPQLLQKALGSLSPRPAGPFPMGAPAQSLARARAALGTSEPRAAGMGVESALELLANLLLREGLDLSHPAVAAHLQPPALTVAVAADALASISNASVDTFDSGPSAIAIERWVMEVLCKLAGLGGTADGVLTPGGSLSNLLGLLLARDGAALKRGFDARKQGVAGFRNPVVFCSEIAHFSVHRACAALGLGEDAVYPVPCDARQRMDVNALARALAELGQERTPLAIVATAGSTDFGSVDPLREISALARKHDVWLHVDAAYGFGALLSQHLRTKLDGIELADSITGDLHKVGFQPAAASVLLVADAKTFGALDRQVAYLNPADDIDAGYDGLLGRSLQTTRRPDAVKIAATLLAHGTKALGEMVDVCHELACHAERRIRREARLELVAPAEMTTVVFRYRDTREDSDVIAIDDATEAGEEIHGAIRRLLLERGEAVIGRTCMRVDAAGTQITCLKFTLLNPTATPADIDALIDAVLEAAAVCTGAKGEQSQVSDRCSHLRLKSPGNGHSGERSDTLVHDLLAVGCGPFNLGLAVLAQTVTDLSFIALDAAPELRWHPGVMFEDARLQVSFLADLVSLVEPTHPFSFLAYLKEVDRMFPFYVRERFHLTRREYEHYLRWAAKKLTTLRFSHRVDSVTWQDSEQVFHVEASDGLGQRKLWHARNVVLGIGTEPCLPAGLAGLPRERLLHSSDYLFRGADVNRARRVSVVGSGQSGAEVFLDLLRRAHPEHEHLAWLTRTASFAPLDYTKLVLEMTTPAYVRYFHALAEPTRDKLVRDQWAHYKGISTDTITEIHELLYQRRVESADTNTELRFGVSVESAQARPDGVVLRCRQADTDTTFEHHADLVVAATGYRQRKPAFMAQLESLMVRDQAGRLRVRLDHSVETDRLLAGRIFVANADTHSHGVAAPDLGVAPIRNATIINTVMGREVYRLPQDTAFTRFAPPTPANEKTVASSASATSARREGCTVTLEAAP